ncbi:MAG: YceK/YidQ family lipoprotein [Granulosicoccus sp.]|nr:YceK/YidQ family lipoprotein [Granulosicoccus sp.]
MKVSKSLYFAGLLTLLIAVGGCATISTLSQPTHKRKPLVMSGVRLDLASLRNDAAATERFGVSPPVYPLLDLPFSAVFDVLALGYTVPVAWFYRH